MKRVPLIRTLAAAAFAAVMASATVHAQAKLEIVGGDTYDWGTVAPGKLTTVVQVKNVGQGDLKVYEVRPGCGCTAAPIDKNMLAAGEIGKISITLDVSSRNGAVDKIVSITSGPNNDTVKDVQVLHLKANVRRAITCEPMQYMLVTDGKVNVESPASPMKVRNTSDAPVTLFRPELVPGGNIKVRFDMKDKVTLKPGEELELKAFVTPNEPTSIYGSVKMKTSSTEIPTIDISINGTIAAPTSAPSAGQSQK